ncbi:MAG: hypothetical protein ACI9MR_003237 [Myxococcota bacterium]|jgi:hypothetical protein
METDIPTFYTHKTRPDWGMATLAWAKRDKRALLFDDGKLRRFKAAYYHLLEPVDLPLDEALARTEHMEQSLELHEARDVATQEAREQGKRLVTLKDQIAIFKHIFKGGFSDPEYISLYRHGENNNLKRHWDGTIEAAATGFEQERMAELLGKRDFTAIVTTFKEVLSSQPLTSGAKHIGILDRLPQGRDQQIAEALFAVLWEEGNYVERMNRLVKSLTMGDAIPSWPVATMAAALVHPNKHVAVKPSVFRAQMRWMAPNAKLKKDPDGPSYKRMRNMASRIAEALSDGDLTPNDMTDVHVFIWETMRPKAKDVLEQLRAMA